MASLGSGGNLRLKIGACIYDVPSFVWHLLPGRRRQWAFVCNRDERLILDAQKRGARCDWQWTSDLHVAKVFPHLGLKLMRRALHDFPIKLRTTEPLVNSNVEVSFIIGHRGMARLRHLLTTLKSIAAQRGASIECIIVEQSQTPEIKKFLPDWIRYVHTPVLSPNMAYSRAWAFNVGARLARANSLILHDGDLLVPEDYAAEVLRGHGEGYEVVNVKRFIFYLSEEHSKRVMEGGRLLLDSPPESVMQNAQGGGSLAMTKEAYFSIGGFDESFVGWGGEDNEFWERAQTRTIWPYGYMPILHLWHESQREKFLSQKASARERYWKLSEIPPEARIDMLLASGMKPSERKYDGDICDC